MDFDEDELKMLKVIFAIADAMVQASRESNYDNVDANTLYSIKEKRCYRWT